MCLFLRCGPRMRVLCAFEKNVTCWFRPVILCVLTPQVFWEFWAYYCGVCNSYSLDFPVSNISCSVYVIGKISWDYAISVRGSICIILWNIQKSLILTWMMNRLSIYVVPMLSREHVSCNSYIMLGISSGKRLLLTQEYLSDYKMNVNEKHI